MGALVALALVTQLGACGAPGDRDLLASGRAHLRQGDARGAVIQFKNLVRSAPASAPARLWLGTALVETGDPAGALIELRRASELGASEDDVAPVQARALLLQRAYGQLVEHYGQVELTQPEAAAALKVSLARAQLALGAGAAARLSIQRALELAPRSEEARLVDAHARLRDGDVPGALGVVDALLAANARQADAWQLKGDLLLRGPVPAAALDAYRQALSLRPGEARYHASLINALLQLRDTKAAAQQLEAMKAARPDHLLTRYFDAQFAHGRGDDMQALELLQEPLRDHPDDANLLNLAGSIEADIDALAQADAHLKLAVQLQPDFAEARRNWARASLRANDPRKALEALKPLLERPDADAQTLALAGRAHTAAGEPGAANKALARAAVLAPQDPAVLAALALSRLAAGDAAAGLRDLHAAAARDSGSAIDVTLIRALVARHDLDGALEAVQALERKLPERALAHDLRGRVLLLRHDAAGARQSFERALEKDRRWFPAVASLAGLDLLDRKPEAAQARFQNLVQLSPRNEQALLALADLMQRGGAAGREKAGALIDRALASNPSSVQARLARIDLLLAQAQPQAALRVAQDAVAALPGQPTLIDRLARLYRATGHEQQAGATFTALASQFPESHLGPLGLAEARLAEQDIEGAARLSQRALELAPDAAPVQRLALTLALKRGRSADALALVRGMQQRRPGDAAPYIFEAEIRAGQRQWVDAVAVLRKAVALPEPAQAPGMLYGMLAQAGKKAEAAQFAARWLQEHPADTLFLLYQGNVSMAQGDAALAESSYAAVLKHQADNVVALNNLAQLLIARKQPGAVALAERAAQAAPGRPELMDTLALALASENQPERALELQKRLVAQSPQATMFRLTLAKIYVQAGDKVLARAELEGLLKPGQTFPGRGEAVALLKQIGSS
jgi:putative PEP-CTERM system TPR-repeat lipoprotein